MGATSPFANVLGQGYEGTNVLATTPQFQTSGGGATLDPRILDILKSATQTFPLKVEAFSGVEGRASGTTNHPGGYAVDVRIYDQSGKPLANSPADAQRRGQNLADNFRTYEAFAQTARDIQTRTYPELSQDFRWGGYFIAGDTPFDLMHFDINPAMHGATGGGDWENGLGSDGQRLLKGADSVGMNAVITRQLADLGYAGPNGVANYQRDHGLTPDGIIGPQTSARVALDVTPPERIPNPYGLHDVATAIASGDPKAVSTALNGANTQIWAAIYDGTPKEQIAGSLQNYLTNLTPWEQANFRANYEAMQGQVKVPLGMDDPIKAALSQSLDLARNPTPEAIRLAASVNPGQTLTTESSGNAGTRDIPRLRPGDGGAATAAPGPEVLGSGNSNVMPRIAPPGEALGSGGLMFNNAAQYPVASPRLAPGEGSVTPFPNESPAPPGSEPSSSPDGGGAFPWNNLTAALGSMFGLPGLPAGAPASNAPSAAASAAQEPPGEPSSSQRWVSDDPTAILQQAIDEISNPAHAWHGPNAQMIAQTQATIRNTPATGGSAAGLSDATFQPPNGTQVMPYVGMGGDYSGKGGTTPASGGLTDANGNPVPMPPATPLEGQPFFGIPDWAAPVPRLRQTPPAPAPQPAAPRIAGPSAPPASRPAPSDPQVLALQRGLLAAGFNPGPLDGVMGPLTRAAMDASKGAKPRITTAAAAPAKAQTQFRPFGGLFANLFGGGAASPPAGSIVTRGDATEASAPRITAEMVNPRVGTAATQGPLGQTQEAVNAQRVADALNNDEDLPDLSYDGPGFATDANRAFYGG